MTSLADRAVVLILLIWGEAATCDDRLARACASHPEMPFLELVRDRVELAVVARAGVVPQPRRRAAVPPDARRDEQEVVPGDRRCHTRKFSTTTFSLAGSAVRRVSLCLPYFLPWGGRSHTAARTASCCPTRSRARRSCPPSSPKKTAPPPPARGAVRQRGRGGGHRLHPIVGGHGARPPPRHRCTCWSCSRATTGARASPSTATSARLAGVVVTHSLLDRRPRAARRGVKLRDDAYHLGARPRPSRPCGCASPGSRPCSSSAPRASRSPAAW